MDIALFNGQKITQQEAARKFHSTVSWDTYFFICPFCNEPLTLTYGNKVSSYFRHRPEINPKDCERRAKAGELNNQAYFRTYNFTNRSRYLPLRLNYSRDSLRLDLEIGFPRLPDDVRQQLTGTRLTIASNEGRLPSVYKLDERLNDDSITYLRVPEISSYYTISLSSRGDNTIPTFPFPYWQKNVLGITDSAVFDAKTGKIIPSGGDVVLKRKYWILTSKDEQFPSTLHLNNCLHYASLGVFGNWRLYEAQALSNILPVQIFFRKYNLFLTDAPPLLYPLFPPYLSRGRVVQHSRPKTFIFAQGDVVFKVFPHSQFYDNKITEKKISVIELRKNDGAQLLAIGREAILKSSFVNNVQTNGLARRTTPNVIVDNEGEILSEDVYLDQLPKRLHIKGEYDGRIVIEKEGTVVREYALKSDEVASIEPQYNTLVHIYQNCDRVRTLEFKRSAPTVPTVDEALLIRNLERLRQGWTTIPHSFAAYIRRLDDFPLVRDWFMKRLREGKIPRGAVRLVEKTCMIKSL